MSKTKGIPQITKNPKQNNVLPGNNDRSSFNFDINNKTSATNEQNNKSESQRENKILKILNEAQLRFIDDDDISTDLETFDNLETNQSVNRILQEGKTVIFHNSSQRHNSNCFSCQKGADASDRIVKKPVTKAEYFEQTENPDDKATKGYRGLQIKSGNGVTKGIQGPLRNLKLCFEGNDEDCNCENYGGTDMCKHDQDDQNLINGEQQNELFKSRQNADNDEQCQTRTTPSGEMVRVIITNFAHSPPPPQPPLPPQRKQKIPIRQKNLEQGHDINSPFRIGKNLRSNATTKEFVGDYEQQKGNFRKLCSEVTEFEDANCNDDNNRNYDNLVDKNVKSATINENCERFCGESQHLEYLGLDDDDPYMEFQEYLEKIKREINEVFEQRHGKNDELPRSPSTDSNTSNNKLQQHETPCSLNDANSDKKLNEISSNSRENRRLTTTRKTPSVLTDCDQEKRAMENQLKDHRQRQHYVAEETSVKCSKLEAKTQDSNDVNIWATTILKELDNLMGSDKRVNVESANTNHEKNHRRNNILRLEKHATIPLQSFNLNVPLTESIDIVNSQTIPARKGAIKFSSTIETKNNIDEPPNSTTINQRDNTFEVLKIEEIRENSPTRPLKLFTKKDILHDDFIQKGSTSTICTSEESIIRSGSAVDEDNKSTSSSAGGDDVSAALSSGKSGNSLDSSETDNETIEPSLQLHNFSKNIDLKKNRYYTIRKNNNDKKSKFKYTQSNSVISSDDPDLLEVLSLCGAGNEDDDILNANVDSDVSEDAKYNEFIDDVVVMRDKSNIDVNISNSRYALSTPTTRKFRSHSIEESSFVTNQHGSEDYDKFPANEVKPKRPFYLPLSQEPFRNGNTSNIRELPSPSSASLHSGQEHIIMQELSIKSNSAPILLKKDKKSDVFSGQQNSLRYSRSQSDRYLAEIEAIEACKWLRAAGFPQYAQMYEDQQFPIDLSNVAKDHPILENDAIQSLYRRLCILNRCANMRVDHAHKHTQKQKDDSDDEGFALSENWTFQPQSRRWSRIGEMGLELPSKQLQDKTDGSSKDSSPDRFDDDKSDLANRPDSAQSDSDAGRIRRSGSERLKDGAKAFLRRVESIKTRRMKRQNREGLVISGPQVLDLNQLNERDFKAANVTFSTPPSPSPTSPIHIYPRGPITGNELKVPTESDKYLSPNRLSLSPKRTTPRPTHSMRTSPLHFFATPMPHLIEGKSDDSSSYCSDSQESGGAKVKLRRQPSRRRFLQRTGKVDDIGIHSDSECHQPVGRKMIFKDSNSNNTEIKVKKLTRGGSLNLGKDSKKYRNTFQSRSFRTRTSIKKNEKEKPEITKEDLKFRSVERWHSFQDNERRPSVIFKKCLAQIDATGTPFSAMSCGQLQMVRKLALVILTGHMERHCPTHRSGWNWELPKFIKKIKTPDYKDKKVYGVPLQLTLQRTGHAFPFPIRAALRWLRLNAFDQIGLFRKSGVKSRITKLKELLETCSDVDCIDIFDTQQAYDVADMLKQYFRDLPECLLTTKMSETFVAIFHHLPPEVRGDAIQSAVLLLPDENREVLLCLLEFLSQVAENADSNQMTANNLAVCWAPSLFHSSISTGRSTSVSPRRRKAGVPDMKELTETKASHECLTFMISHYKQIFTITPEKMKRCSFSYMEESRPVPLEQLGEDLQIQNWKGYLYECTSATIKEGREKTRGWVTVQSLDSAVEIAFKKVGDGHPLRLWRCITEVEAPPIEVLDYILKERNSWDVYVIKCRTVLKLDDRSEIFQYTCDGQHLTDYCVLRSWQSDLPKGACVIVETSVEHPSAQFPPGGIRGVVLASRYLIEPCGSGRSRVMHLARVDAKGKTPEWYNKCYGNICSINLSKIRSAFRHVADGPESKV